MRILWIDDEPRRAGKLFQAQRDYCEQRRSMKTGGNMLPFFMPQDITFAHGKDQVDYCLFHVVNWDVILLDADMPLYSGIEVAKEYLIYLRIPVIIVSANIAATVEIAGILSEHNVVYYPAPITMPNTIVDLLYQINRNSK